MSTPRISVVITLFNKAEYVVAAVESVLYGDFKPCEVLVIDDGSTDDGAARVEAIGAPLVRVVRQSNAGVSAARNLGIEESNGNFVAFLDADDYWEPDYLARITNLISRFPDCVLYSTSYYLLYSDGTRRRQHLAGEARTVGPTRIRRYFETRSRSLFFCTCSVVISREVLIRKDLFFPVGESLGEDQDLWFRLAELGDIAFDPHPSVAYRQIAGASLSKHPTTTAQLPFIKRLAERYERGEVAVRHRRGVRRLLVVDQVVRSRAHLVSGNLKDAQRLIFQPKIIYAGTFSLRTLFDVFMTTFFPSHLEKVRRR